MVENGNVIWFILTQYRKYQFSVEGNTGYFRTAVISGFLFLFLNGRDDFLSKDKTGVLPPLMWFNKILRHIQVPSSHPCHILSFSSFPWCPLTYFYLSLFFILFLSLYPLSGFSGRLIQPPRCQTILWPLLFPQREKKNHFYTKVEMVLMWGRRGEL